MEGYTLIGSPFLSSPRIIGDINDKDTFSWRHHSKNIHGLWRFDQSQVIASSYVLLVVVHLLIICSHAANCERSGSPRTPSVNQDGRQCPYTLCNQARTQHSQCHHQILPPVDDPCHCQINAGLHDNLAHGANRFRVIPASISCIPNQGQGTAAMTIVTATSGHFVTSSSSRDPAISTSPCSENGYFSQPLAHKVIM